MEVSPKNGITKIVVTLSFAVLIYCIPFVYRTKKKNF